MTSKLKVNLINDSGDNNLITSDGSGVITSSKFKIGQVVQGTTTTEITSTTSSFADTGLSASITPSSTSSKILVSVCQNGCRSQSNDNNNSINIKLLRDSTEISYFYKYALYMGAGNDLYGTTLSVNFLDSPSTTSSITYKTTYSNYGSGNIRLQDTSAESTITLMEVLP
tara:strand:+ start:834 stop:1343 length:510 start_codon:yes stop_codon:yes gene_type:complete